MNIENAVNILNQIEWALLNNSLNKLDYSLQEINEANELCALHRLRTFTLERICEIYVLMKSPMINITKKLSDTNILSNN